MKISVRLISKKNGCVTLAKSSSFFLEEDWTTAGKLIYWSSKA